MSTIVDSVNGLLGNTAIKPACRVATSANITLSGEQTINSVAVVTGDRVLVKNQTDQTTNGIYSVSTGAWQRTADFDGNRDVLQGTLVWVGLNSTTPGVLYQVTTSNPIVVGTSNIVFIQASFTTPNNVLNYGADITDVTSSVSAIQASHDAIYNAAVTAGDNLPSGSAIIPPGKYKMDSGLTWRPWVKLDTSGPTYLDFTSLSSSGTAFRCHNESGPTSSSGKGTANLGPVISGAQGGILFNGPGASTSSIAFDVGNTSSLATARAFNHVKFDNIGAQNFGTFINMRNYDTYLTSWTNCYMENCDVAIKSNSGASTNSGERITFFNNTFAGAYGSSNKLGILITNQVEYFFNNCSFDFVYNSLLKFDTGASYSHIVFNQCHFESANDLGLIVSTLGSSNSILVTIRDCTLVPTNRAGSVSGISGVRSDGGSLPRIALFQSGAYNLILDGLRISGYANNSGDATNGMFMIDSSKVNVVSVRNLFFTDYRQAPAASLVRNRNYNFNEGTTGDSLDYSTTPGWYYRSSTTAAAVLSTTQVFGGSAHSLKITASGASSLYVICSDAIPIDRMDRFINQHAIYGASSTGTLSVTHTPVWLQSAYTPAQSISSITQSGGLATVTTGAAHGLKAEQLVYISGCGVTAYNGWKVIRSVPLTTTFTFSVPSATTSPESGGTPVYIVEPYTVLSVGSDQSDNFSTIYSNTSDPAYTGNRNWWAKATTIGSPGIFQYAAPAGATHLRLKASITNLDNGDVIYYGASLVCKV